MAVIPHNFSESSYIELSTVNSLPPLIAMSRLCLLLAFLAVLCLSSSPADAAQSQCDNGESVLPCPTVSSTWTQWGISWRNYTAIGIAGKGVFGPHNAVLESIEEALPTLLQYFNGTNADKAILERTIPIMVMQEVAGNQTAYMVSFFLPDAYLQSPPGFVNATGFLHLNTWPTATASFSPIVYSFLDRATNENIASNLALLQAELKAHQQPFWGGLSAYVTYGPPRAGLQQNEVWFFQTNPFPGHALGHSRRPRLKTMMGK